jgi:hypothetical protein
MRWGRFVVGGLLIATGCKSSSNGNQTPDADVLACAAVVDCVAGDGCCPATCTNATDGDCSASCGDGTIDPTETCDPPDSCPTACGDGDVCTKDVVAGSAANCNIACANTPITMCAGGDGCCPSGCDNNSDPDCPPPPGTALTDRLTVSSVTAAATPLAGDSNYRIWGSSSLRVAPVFTIPFADCGTLVGYTTGTSAAPRARVARLDAGDQLVTTCDLGQYVLRGLAGEPDGHFGALLWDISTNPKSLKVIRYTSNGTAGTTATLPTNNAAPTDFGIGESRLEYDVAGNRYGAYFHVHGTNPSYFAYGHEGDMLGWINKTTGAITLGWEWGCSHSMSELLRFSPSANTVLPVCATDCYPGTSGSNFATDSIGGVYLNHSEKKVRDFDGGCNGKVAAEVGSLAPAAAGWMLVFNGHQNAATNGQSSYSTSTMNQDIGFVPIASNKTPGAIVWLTTTTGNEANSSIARWEPMGGTGEQYVVGWSAGTTFNLARVSAAGAFLEGPTAITTAKWGERSDPFRTHLNSDIVWAWFDSTTATTLKFARLRSGGTAPSCAALP